MGEVQAGAESWEPSERGGLQGRRGRGRQRCRDLGAHGGGCWDEGQGVVAACSVWTDAGRAV